MEWIWQEIPALLAINAALILAAVLTLWVIGIRIRDVSIIDMAFAVILLAVALASYRIADGAHSRKLLLVSLVAIWAVRITIHLVRRNWGHGEDPRYSKLRSWVGTERAFLWLSLRKVFLTQGIVLWLVSLPVQIGQAYPEPEELGLLALIGAAVCLLGIAVESLADYQLTRFRADPQNKGRILQSGLWRYSRHPNYFGELCVWWGLFLIACEHWIGLFTIVGPIAYTHLIVNVTGQRTLDKKLAREKPGYKAYMDTTSGLIPMPPRTRR